MPVITSKNAANTPEAANTTAKTKKDMREELKRLEAEAKVKAAEKKLQEEKDKLQAKEDAAKAKADEKAKKQEEAKQAREAKKEESAKLQEAELQAISNSIAATEAPLPTAPDNTIIDALNSGDTLAALRSCFFAEKNAERGYTTLGEKFGWSVTPIIQELTAKGVWPINAANEPVGYKRALKAEKEAGKIAFAHYINRASERFAMLNPKTRAEQEAKRKEAAFQRAADKLAGIKPTKNKAAAEVSKDYDVSKLTQEELFDLAKVIIMAMDENTCDLLAMDGDVAARLKIDLEDNE